MHEIEQWIATNIEAYGPIAVFLLLLISGMGGALGEEMVIVPAGMLIASGRVNLWSIGIACYLGVVLADLLWFLVCHAYGTPLLHRRWFKRLIHPRRMLETKHQFERRGVWLIVFARFIPSSRTAAITIAGMFHMPFWRFALATVLCTFLSVPAQLGLGYLAGRHLAGEDFGTILRAIIGLVTLVVAVTFGLRVWARYRAGKNRPPRAKAAWLRRFRRPRRQPAAGQPGSGQNSAGGPAEG